MEMPNLNFDMDIPSLRQAIGLTYIEAKVLQLLMQEETATHQQLLEINSRIRQIMYSLRNKLKSQGVSIINDRDIGYSLSLKYKLRIKNLIEGELIDEIKRAHKISERLANE
jgi:hypothetical protein